MLDSRLASPNGARRDAVTRLLKPRSLAFVGASDSPVKVGGRRWLSMIGVGFSGPLYPVHPTRDSVAGFKAVRSLSEIPGEVDLVVIATPPQSVDGVIEDCVRKSVAGAIVITGGFGEHSQEGRDAEQNMARRLRAIGARMIGPNCAGIFSAPGAVNVTGMVIPKGPIGLITQSGNILLDLAHRARASGIGFSHAVSTGNGVDIRPPELLDFMLEDPDTKAVIVYVEGWLEGEARLFCDIARRNPAHKPIIVLKPGETEAGMRAVMSHTGSLAGEMRIAEGAFSQSGILKAASIDDAWQLALALGSLPPLRQRTLGVASDGGGHATLGCDAAALAGFDIVPFPANLKARLGSMLPERCPTANPLDYAGYAEEKPAVVAASIETCLAAPEMGAMLLAGHFGGYHHLAGPSIRDEEIAAAHALGDAMRKHGKPIVVHSVYAQDSETAVDAMRAEGIPVLRSLPEAARILEGLARHADMAQAGADAAEETESPAFDCAGILARRMQDGVVLESDAREVMRAYRLPIAAEQLVDNAADCRAAVERFGPSALKIVSGKIVHKSDVGGVILNVGPDSAAAAYERLIAIGKQAGDAQAKVIVSPMIGKGTEFILGAFRDANFGPVVMLGIGGVFVEVLHDVVFRLAPLSLAEAENMVASLRSHALLDGYRGSAPVDRIALAKAVRQLSHLIVRESAISEIDINPLIANADGLNIVDVRIIAGID